MLTTGKATARGLLARKGKTHGQSDEEVSVSQSVSHYHTPTNGAHGPYTHSDLLYERAMESQSIFCGFFWQGSHFRLILRLQCLPFALQETKCCMCKNFLEDATQLSQGAGRAVIR